MTQVSFPGLGLGPWQFDGVAFTLFGIDIAWYGLLITMGMVFAFFYGLWQAKKVGIKSDDIVDLAILIVIFSITGARLLYVLFPPEGVSSFLATGGTFWENAKQTIVNVLSIREGGLSIFGGVFGGFMAGLIVSKWKKIRFPILLDILSPCVMIGQIIGRWGNFINGEAYGGVTSLPWGMNIQRVEFYPDLIESERYLPCEKGIGLTECVHPTFFYESVWNLIGLVLIMVFHKKKQFQGQVFAFYLIWYGSGRAVLEGLRTDSMLLFGLRLNQLIGIAIVIIGLVIMVCGYLKAKKNIDVVAKVIKTAKGLFKKIKGLFKKKSNGKARTSERNTKVIDKSDSADKDKEE